MSLSCIGNDNLHLLTYDGGRHHLRIDLKDWEGNKPYATYNNFKVGSEHEKYSLDSLGIFGGTAGWCITITA